MKPINEPQTLGNAPFKSGEEFVRELQQIRNSQENIMRTVGLTSSRPKGRLFLRRCAMICESLRREPASPGRPMIMSTMLSSCGN
jgi:hypothetical protein